jgi:hypothetical protein
MRWAVRQYESGYAGMELDRMMEHPWAARHRSCGASSFGAEWVEAGTRAKGPESGPIGNKKTIEPTSNTWMRFQRRCRLTG